MTQDGTPSTSMKRLLESCEQTAPLLISPTFCFATQNLTNVQTSLTKKNAKLHEM